MRAGGRDAKLPGSSTNLGVGAEIGRGQEQHVVAELLERRQGIPDAVPLQCEAPVEETGLLICRRFGGAQGIVVGEQALPPFAERQRSIAVQRAFGCGVAGAVHDIAAKAFEERAEGIGIPFATIVHAQFERVFEFARSLDGGQSCVELVLGPRLVERRDADAVFLQH